MKHPYAPNLPQFLIDLIQAPGECSGLARQHPLSAVNPATVRQFTQCRRDKHPPSVLVPQNDGGAPVGGAVPNHLWHSGAGAFFGNACEGIRVGVGGLLPGSLRPGSLIPLRLEQFAMPVLYITVPWIIHAYSAWRLSYSAIYTYI